MLIIAHHPARYDRTMKSRIAQVRLLGFGMLLGSLAPSAHSQATQTADQRIRIKAFAMASYVRPDYGGALKNGGGTVGTDIDGFRLLPHTDIGMDIRYTASEGRVSNQYLFAGGPHISFNAYRFRPYVDYLIGVGDAHFNQSPDPAYTYDETRTRGYGAGFDYGITRFWSVRADAQRQRWRFSVRAPPFNPVEISVGAAYQLHFRSRYGPE